VTHLASKNKERSIHRLFLQNYPHHRGSFVDAASEIYRLVHDEHIGIAGKLNHAVPPARQKDDKSSVDSDVNENIRSVIPLAVSASATGEERKTAGASSNRENVGTGTPIDFDLRFFRTENHDVLRLVACATRDTPCTFTARSTRERKSSGTLAVTDTRFFRHSLNTSRKSFNDASLIILFS
jgi:hypothetical protein